MLDNRHGVGGNNPPDPIETVLAEYDAVIAEAQNWADGEPVDDEAGMKAVDEVLKGFKSYKTALGKAGKERTDPLHKAWKAEVAAVKVYTDDAALLQEALVACVAPFKAKLAAEKEAAERAAWEAAEKARREAEAKAAQANAADIEAQREAHEARQAALEADKAARAQRKDAVKGMRTVHHFEVTDMRALVNWLARNRKDEVAEFAMGFAERNHKTTPMDGVNTWTTKEAF